ncbi:hypothetical protein [Raineyella sp. W15-4]|uniref:hypothetical protein n=1 Tax=Raineyella sp. W15-4 TaxID=3081651 RepID=UPI002952F0F9|nr:hypothetical protein [Raineyella sp. W15-4]WOQ16966.1 hypothetical protein R0145_17465 [Raineyella sp. W15-4]
MQALSHDPGKYAVLQVGLYVIVAVLLVHAFFSGQLRINNRTILLMVIAIIGSQALRALLSIILGTTLVGRDVLLLPLLMLILGFNSTVDEHRTGIISYAYGAAAAFSGWYVVATFGENIAYAGQYFFVQKNQLGAVLGAAAALLFYEIVQSLDRTPSSTLSPLLAGALLVGVLIPLFELRNRSTIIGLIVLATVISVKVVLGRRVRAVTRIFFFALLTAAIIFSRQLGGIFFDALFANYDTADPNSISANRIDVYYETLIFLRSHLLSGELLNSSGIFDPHNFILYQLLKYGILLSLVYFAFYFFFGYRLLRVWSVTRILEVPPWAYLLVISYTTSLFEYAQPFGPGTTQMVAWYFVGLSLTRERNG